MVGAVPCHLFPAWHQSAVLPHTPNTDCEHTVVSQVPSLPISGYVSAAHCILINHLAHLTTLKCEIDLTLK